MKKEGCIFCMIANGEIPSDTLYEDQDLRMILDINPASKGHALILPKSHHDDLFDMDEESLGKILSLARKAGAAMKETLGCDGINVIQNNGEAAGQTVRHFHMHIIPRYNGDNALPLWTPGVSEPEERAQTAKELKAKI